VSVCRIKFSKKDVTEQYARVRVELDKLSLMLNPAQKSCRGCYSNNTESTSFPCCHCLNMVSAGDLRFEWRRRSFGKQVRFEPITFWVKDAKCDDCGSVMAKGFVVRKGYEGSIGFVCAACKKKRKQQSKETSK